MRITGWLAGLTLAMVATGAGAALYPSNPTVDEDAWFVSGDGLSRFDRASGRRQWRVLAGEPVSDPVRLGGRLLVTAVGRLIAVDAASGRTEWIRPLADDPFAPVVAGGRILLASREGRLTALSLGQGRTLWSVRPGRGWIYPPAVQPGRLITGGQDGVVWALDPADGSILWRTPLEQELVYAPRALDRHRLVVTTFSGAVTALDGATGRQLWTQRFPAPSLRAFPLAGLLLLPGMDGVLRALDPADGHLRWSYDAGARLLPTLSADAARVLVSTGEGEQILLRIADGGLIARYRSSGEPVAARLLDDGGLALFVQRRNEPGSGPVLVYAGRR